MRSQLMMMMMMMMMRVILSMNDGRADPCSHFRCRKTCTHACIYIYDKHTCQFGRSSNVQFLVGIHFFNSFSLLSISLSISLSPSLYISLSFSLSISYFLAYFQPVPRCFCTCVHVLPFFCPSFQTSLLHSFTPSCQRNFPDAFLLLLCLPCFLPFFSLL